MTVEQQWHLARLWYEDQLALDWQRRTPEQAQAVFAEVGLAGSFWSLIPHGSGEPEV